MALSLTLTPVTSSPQMSVLVSLRYLQTSLDGVDPENPEADSEGYILAKGVKETMMDVKNTMFKLLQFGQVVYYSTHNAL